MFLRRPATFICILIDVYQLLMSSRVKEEEEKLIKFASLPRSTPSHTER